MYDAYIRAYSVAYVVTVSDSKLLLRSRPNGLSWPIIDLTF